MNRAAGRCFDAVVVGAGPAGAVAAFRLAGAGHAVLLLDRHAPPREKVCGDALIPDAVRALARAGLLVRVAARARAVAGLTVLSPARIPVTLAGSFLTLEREVLDTLLVNAAVESGARFERAHVRAVHDGTPVRVQGDGLGDVSARVAIITTGADLSLLAPLRMILRRRASAAAVRLYVRSDAPLDRLLISYDRAVVPGYGWVFPLPEGRFNVGCGLFLRGRRNAATGLRRLFDAFVTQVPQAREVLAGARERTPLRGAALRCGLTGVVPRRGNILVAGEALGATFPATGEGIGKALETGELAAVCAGAALRSGDDDPLRDYSGMIAALAPRYRGYRIAQSWLAWPALCDLVARRVCASARLRALSEGILDETVDPRRLFSVRALAASLRR